jgi:alpha/beta superfamily hydrolase
VERLTFQTEDGLTLEGERWLPEGQIRASAVVCHPHPQFGGSKDHPVLWAIRIGLVRRGFVVLAFNFRGVMGSEGLYGGGRTEPADVRAAISTAGSDAPGPVFVAGWSFGANVALRAAIDDDRVGALALVALPLAEASPEVPPLPGPEQLARFDRPVLLLAGDDDPFCPVPELLGVAGALPHPTVSIIEGTGHFFPRHEREAGEIVGRFAEESLLKE